MHKKLPGMSINSGGSRAALTHNQKASMGGECAAAQKSADEGVMILGHCQPG